MADFMQAIKWLKEGKKIRRKDWEPNYFLLKGGVIYWDDGQEAIMDLERYNANDWEIVEEEAEWNLNDLLVFWKDEGGVEMVKCPTHILKEFIKRQLEFDWTSYSCKERDEAMIPKKRLDEFFEKFKKEAGGKLT